MNQLDFVLRRINIETEQERTKKELFHIFYLD